MGVTDGLWRPADLASARRQARTLNQQGHRPWPVPERPWVMGQTWERLLFAHWRVDADRLRAVVPPQVPIDLFDGSAWIGVTPFMVTGMRPRLVPPVPGAARFPEINVRTYATVDGRPGIYFLSLDTPNRPAVVAARRLYRLPYFRSQSECVQHHDLTSFRSRRADPSGPPASFAATYEGAGSPATAAPGSFEYWATERYCLYTLDSRQRLLRGDIHHPPWKLRPAEATVTDNSMGAQVSVALDDAPVVHLAERQDVVFWPNTRV